ncbi:uncharacterized protein LOC114937286, partial [Nylanderia fulva]|uniref:uncharacterized protein LOC114937286 n=1 Tax=Nylanderia fulva TaxID=613905 RepID=UPI0010FB725D
QDPSTKEYLQLALARVLELQRKINEGTYVAEIDHDSGDPDSSGNDEDLMKEIFAKVFQDLPGTSGSLAKIIDGGTYRRNPRMDAIYSKRIQLLGFDTCRRMALEFMKSIVQESRNSSASLSDTVEPGDLTLQPNESCLRDKIVASDLRKRESSAETRARMLRSLDLHLATKQRDYTAKLMNSSKQ